MLSRRRFIALCGRALVLPVVLQACTKLRDKEPFTVTVTYADAPDGSLVVTGPDPKNPLLLTGDADFGQVQVVNDSAKEHAFSIDDLAVYETIPPGRTKTLTVQEAKDNRTYTFYCHLHPGEFQGKLQIHYLAEEER